MEPLEFNLDGVREIMHNLNEGKPFTEEDLRHLIESVEAFCESYPKSEEIPRKTARLLSELVPQLDFVAQKYDSEKAKKIRDAAAELFVVMLERL